MAKPRADKNVPKSKKALSRKTPHVPGQYAGYSLQTTRCLARLLEAMPGSHVSIEVFDDVGIESGEGNKTAEQVKSTHDGNPISDRSVDLWKTFSNWIDAVEAGEIQLDNTRFEIYVSRPVTGDIVESFSAAGSIRAAYAALELAKEKLWGIAPDYALKGKVADGIKEYVDKVFLSDETIACSVIEAFTYSCGSGSPHADLESLMAQKFVREEIVPDMVVHALGWVKKQTDELLEQKKPAIISWDAFHAEMTSYFRKIDRRQILESFAKAPDDAEIKQDLILKVYVRQLEMIECDDDEKFQAVNDYLRSSVDRTIWSEKGFVHESSFDEFEDNLIRAWKNNQRASSIEVAGRNDIDKGKLLYSKCSMHQARLEGLDVPSHFTPGSFHALSDEESVGWHPQFKSKLESARDKGTKK